MVYCSFLLLWVKDPLKVLKEMKRVSRGWVVCLAEPDYGGRISYPADIAYLDDLVIEGMKKSGADPHIGRKLPSMFAKCDLRADIGVYPSEWNIDHMSREGEDEWRTIETATMLDMKDERWLKARTTWVAALKEGSLFQFNPVFYAIAKKEGSHREK
jgi:hypothetical protein